MVRGRFYLSLVLCVLGFAAACPTGGAPDAGSGSTERRDAGGRGSNDAGGGGDETDADGGDDTDGGAPPLDGGSFDAGAPVLPEIVFHPELAVIDELVDASSISVEGDTIIIPASSLPDPQQLAGKLVATSAGSYGKLGWVESTSIVGEEAHIAVRPAGLDAAIVAGEVETTLDLAADNATFMNFSGEILNLDGSELINEDGVVGTLEKGSLTLSGSLRTKLSFDINDLTAADFVLENASLGTNIVVDLDVTDVFSKGVQTSLGALNKKYVFWAGGVLPIVVVVKLAVSLEAGIQPSTPLHIKYGGARTDDFEAGVHYTEEGGWTGTFEHLGTTQSPITPEVTTDIGITASTSLNPSLEALIYGLAGPRLSFRAAATAEVRASDPRCNHQVRAEVSGSAVGVASFLDEPIPETSFELFDITKVFLSALDQDYYQAECCGTPEAPRVYSLTWDTYEDLFGCEVLHGPLTISLPTHPDGAEAEGKTFDLAFLREVSGDIALTAALGTTVPTHIDLSALEVIDGNLRGPVTSAPVTVDLNQLASAGSVSVNVDFWTLPPDAVWGQDRFIPAFGFDPAYELDAQMVIYTYGDGDVTIPVPPAVRMLHVTQAGAGTLALPGITSAECVSVFQVNGRVDLSTLETVGGWAASPAGHQCSSTSAYVASAGGLYVHPAAPGATADLGALTSATGIVAIRGSGLYDISSSTPFSTSLPSLTSAGGFEVFGIVEGVSVPALATVEGTVLIAGDLRATTIDFPALASADRLYVEQHLNVETTAAVASLGLGSLASAQLVGVHGLPQLSTLSLPVFVSGDLSTGQVESLTTFSLPAFTTGDLYLRDVTSLTSSGVSLTSIAAPSSLTFHNAPLISSCWYQTLVDSTGITGYCSLCDGSTC